MARSTIHLGRGLFRRAMCTHKGWLHWKSRWAPFLLGILGSEVAVVLEASGEPLVPRPFQRVVNQRISALEPAGHRQVLGSQELGVEEL